MLPLKALYRKLCTASNAELDAAFAAGVLPDTAALCGYEFYGYNVSKLAQTLGLTKFKKAFVARDNGRTKVGGYNCKVKPTRLDGPWENGGPGGAYQGYYDVKPPAEGAAIASHPNALYLDYGSDPSNSLLDGSFLRDFVVQVDPAEPDVFLGKAYIKLGPIQMGFSYFVLQRAHRATQPAAFYVAA